MTVQLGYERVQTLARGRGVKIVPNVFYFLRHGQTPRNALKIFQCYDEPLSELGQKQAVDAAAALANEPIRALVVSDAKRTLQTAEPAAKALKLTPIPTPLMKERNFGALVGTSSATIDWDCKPEGGETLDEFVNRSLSGIEFSLNRPEEQQPTLIVAHGGNLLVLVNALGIAVDRSKFSNALPLKFTRVDGQWHITPLLAPTDPAHANMS